MCSRHLCLLGSLVFLISCAGTSKTVKMFSQPQVNALVVSGRFQEAADVVKTQRSAYGPKNELLLLLDKAYVLQIAGYYAESIRVFERAKQTLDELYTRSISNIATTWLINDNRAPYRGEYFEHTLINILQSFNYAALGDIPEALVEMRDADRKLKVLNDIYRYHRSPVYREDAFARLWAGILYENRGGRQDINDALIAYRNSIKIYEDGFHHRTGISPPQVLIRNLLAAAEYLGFTEFSQWRQKFPSVEYLSVAARAQKAEVYLVHHNGLSPIKHPRNIPVPLPGGSLSQLAFPVYDTRYYSVSSSVLAAVKDGVVRQSSTELCANIEAIAEQSLNDRKAQVYAKSALRPLGKYVAQQALANSVENAHGDAAATAVKGASSIYNLFSEQADLRSWQTLPAEIRIAHMVLEPGAYEFSAQLWGRDGGLFQTRPLGRMTLKRGDKKFFILRTVE